MGRAGPIAYQLVARDLRTALLQRRYDDGNQLPTEAQLAERYQLSRQTVRRAFQDLVADGMVFRVPGRGTFATPRDRRYVRHFGSIEDLMGLSLDTDLEVITPLARCVDIGAAGRLRLDSDVVAKVSFRRRHGGTAFSTTDVFLPPTVAVKLDDVPELHTAGSVSRATVIGLLDVRLDRLIVSAEQSITATAATADLAAVLSCDPERPLLRIDRVYVDGAGSPIELAISHFLPEHYSYRLNLRRSAT
jgi:GntR family transcriptional regulator